MKAQRGVGSGEGLSAVESLRADLADVVHAHQRTRAAPLGVFERRAGSARDRFQPRRLRRAREGAQGVVGDRQQAVGGGESDRVHEGARIAADARCNGRNPRCAKTT